MTQIDNTFLTSIKETAKDQSEIVLSSEQLVVWVGYTERLRETLIELLAEKSKLQKDLKKTQYLSSIWIKSLTAVMPEHMQKAAISVASQAIAKGLKEAGLEEYDVDF